MDSLKSEILDKTIRSIAIAASIGLEVEDRVLEMAEAKRFEPAMGRINPKAQISHFEASHSGINLTSL